MDVQTLDPNYLRVIYELRGRVLQMCIELEMAMDLYIAEYFCDTDDKALELAAIVLAPRITWGEKIEIFIVVIEKYNRAFMAEYPDFKAELKNITEHRNVFAHFPANTTPVGVESFKKERIVTFIKFKNSKLPETKEIVYNRQPYYTEEKINSIISGIHKYTEAIRKMWKTY